MNRTFGLGCGAVWTQEVPNARQKPTSASSRWGVVFDWMIRGIAMGCFSGRPLLWTRLGEVSLHNGSILALRYVLPDSCRKQAYRGATVPAAVWRTARRLSSSIWSDSGDRP